MSTEELESLLKEQPNDLVALIRLAESYEKQGASAKSANAYERAVKLNPKLLSAVVKLAQLYAGPLQNKDKALEFARNARQLAPSDPQIAAIVGRIAYQAGNFTWAYSLLQESARQLINEPAILHDAAWAAYSLGKVGEAQQTMQRLLDSAPNSTQAEDAKRFLAMTALDDASKDFSAAAAEVDQLLKTDPQYVPALMARAAIHLQRGEAKAAEDIYHATLRRFPDFAPAQKAWPLWVSSGGPQEHRNGLWAGYESPQSPNR